MRYETDSNSFKIENTENGYLSKVILKGTTLVNHSSINRQTLNFGGSARNTPISNIKPNTKYTYFFNIVENTLNHDLEQDGVGVWNETTTQGLLPIGQIVISRNQVGLIKKVITTPTDLSTYNFTSAFRTYNASISGTITIEEMILEGDYTQNPPSYFEGVKSVGDGVENIEVKSHGKNLANPSHKMNDLYVDGTTSTIMANIGARSILLRLEKNTDYVISFNKNIDRATIGLSNTIPVLGSSVTKGSTTILEGLRKYKFNSGNFQYAVYYYNSTDIDIDIQLEKNTVATAYEPFKSDKKTALYKDIDGTWKKPIIRGVNDSIRDLYDSDVLKYYKRCEEIILTGDETFTTHSVSYPSDNSNMFGVMVNKAKKGNNPTSLSNKFANVAITEHREVEGFFISTYSTGMGIYFRVFNSRLETQNIEGFKKLVKQWYVEGNPLTVVYPLEQEEVYQCTPISVASFKNETTYQIESGAMSPNSTFETDYTLSNAVNRIKDIKVFNRAMTDNSIYKINKIIDIL